jgi:hypothetical protein
MARQLIVRHSMLRAALGGLALGLLWGVAARVYMRLVAPDPDFSWVGTLFILGLAGFLGTGLGLVWAAKAQGRRRWWLLALLPGLLLFAGQGIPFIPAFVLGGLAFTHRHSALRGLGAAAIVGGVVGFWFLVRFDSDTMLSTPTDMLVRLIVGMTVLSLGVAAAGSVLYRRWEPRTRSATIAPIGRADVAAGEGALAT